MYVIGIRPERSATEVHPSVTPLIADSPNGIRIVGGGLKRIPSRYRYRQLAKGTANQTHTEMESERNVFRNVITVPTSAKHWLLKLFVLTTRRIKFDTLTPCILEIYFGSTNTLMIFCITSFLYSCQYDSADHFLFSRYKFSGTFAAFRKGSGKASGGGTFSTLGWLLVSRGAP